MKDVRFIALLNLYIDQQIEPEDAAELEAEIVRNSARRQTYLEYCRLHRACMLLQEGSQPRATGAKLATALAAADAKILEFPAPRRAYRGMVIAGGLLSAAAAIAFAFVLYRPAARVASDHGDEIVQIEPTAAPINPGPNSAPIQTYTTVLLSRPAAATGDNYLRSGNTNSSLDWMRDLSLAPLTPVTADNLDDFMRISIRPTRIDYRSTRPVQDAVESSALQFTK